MITFLNHEEQHQHENGGGWVANTANVEATAFVGCDARVSGDAQVSGYARVSGDAGVFGNARVFDGARVFDDARVSGNAQVSGYAWMTGNARVTGNAQVYGAAWVTDNAWEMSPLYIQGTKHSVTNCAHGSIAIGCLVHTFAEWKAKYKAIGKAEGYTAAQIKEYGHHIAYVIKVGK